MRNQGGIGFGFGEVATWAVRELGIFFGCGVFIIIVLEAALPVRDMCEYDLFFFRFFFGRSG